jgi:hypothetical protein
MGMLPQYFSYGVRKVRNRLATELEEWRRLLNEETIRNSSTNF